MLAEYPKWAEKGFTSLPGTWLAITWKVASNVQNNEKILLRPTYPSRYKRIPSIIGKLRKTWNDVLAASHLKQMGKKFTYSNKRVWRINDKSITTVSLKIRYLQDMLPFPITLASPSVAHGPAALASPRGVLERQDLRPRLRPAPKNLHMGKIPSDLRAR